MLFRLSCLAICWALLALMEPMMVDALEKDEQRKAKEVFTKTN